MSEGTNVRATLDQMRKVRQIRQYRPDPVPDDVLGELLEYDWPHSITRYHPNRRYGHCGPDEWNYLTAEG